MITASIRFLTNKLVMELNCKNSELCENLQSIGVLTPPNLMKLDNARTLQVNLTPNDETGEFIYSLVNSQKDTLGNVQRLCRYVHCMNDKHKEIFTAKVETGEIKSVVQGIKIAERMREENSR